jgi:hypothetical protein
MDKGVCHETHPIDTRFGGLVGGVRAGRRDRRMQARPLIQTVVPWPTMDKGVCHETALSHVWMAPGLQEFFA